MDTITASVFDTGGFWPSDRPNACHGRGDQDEGDYGVSHHGSGTWEGRSMGLQDLGHSGSEETGYGYNSYGYSNNHDEWGGGPSDLDADIKMGLPQKRRSESLSNDGYDRPETPNSPLLQASSSRQRSSGAGPTGTGSLFFKTKLCVKFKAGTCPYNSNCNFAHGMDELRKPPAGWEDMVGALDAGGGGGGANAVPSSMDSLRFRRTRRCKKYYSEEGCPYGDRCNFLHDDQAKNRESNAISLGPTTGSAAGGGAGGNGGAGERPSNWKTRMCNKWEMTGHCPFGQKCNFAHGHAELQMYAGGSPADGEAKASSGSVFPSDNKQIARAAPKSYTEVGSSIILTMDTLNSNVTVRSRSTYTPPSKSQKQMKVITNWRGPADEISTIYGDWIGEDD